MSYASEVLADSPLFYLHFDETSGTTASDASGNGHDGTYFNSPTLGATSLVPSDPSGKAVTFNGTNQLAYLTSASWMNTSALTVEAVIKTSSAALQQIIDRDNDTGLRAWQWRVSGGKAQIIINPGSGPSVTGSVTVNDGVAHHVAATYDGATIKLYVDGALDGSTSYSGALANGSLDITIARRQSGDNHFAGTIDEPAFFGAAISASRIAAHYAAFTGGAALSSSQTDSAGLTDDASASIVLTATLDDGAGLTDTLSALVVRELTATDNAGLTDSVSTAVDHVLTITDDVGLTDAADPQWYEDTVVDWPSDDPGEATDPPDIAGTHDTDDTAPALDPVPTGVAAPSIIRRSLVWPNPTLVNGFPDPDVWVPTSETVEDLGRFQVVVDGIDRTWFRDAPVLVGGWTKNQPFGDNESSLILQQVSVFEKPGSGDLAWLKPGAGVEIHRRLEDGSGRKVRFEGFIPKFSKMERGKTGNLTVKLVGALYEADLSVHRPKFYYDDVDLGARIREAFREVRSRHYIDPPLVTTGIPTKKRGTMDQSPLAFAQELLALATTADGTNQWTVDKTPGRRAILRLKDTTTVHWTVTAGTPGVDLDLDRDYTAAPNAYYGEGTAPDGCTWRNAKYPNARADDAPPYPYSDPDQVITLDTVGPEVRLWQTEMNNNGYPLDIDGYYGPEDAFQCRRLQHAAGILVDGIVGPQTWAATFEVGSNVGDLNGAYIAALAYRKEVEPYLFNAQGAIIGDNPDYDPRILRVEQYTNYGDGVSKRDATRQALSDLHRYGDPGWLGELILTNDPEEGTRWDIDEGQNIKVKHYSGTGSTGLLLHIAGVDANTEQGTVRLTVDSKARDLMKVTAIRARDREAHSPAFDHLGNRPSAAVRDVSGWDCENGAGVIPRHALYGGLWTVLRIPAGRAGTIAQTRFTTTGPASKFAVGVFSKPITAADLVSIVGNPLTASKSWTMQYDALTAFGWLIAWGDKDQPAGYFPGLGSDSDPLTGRLVDDQVWNYESTRPPWLWVAEFSADSCFIEGRLRQQVVTL